MSDEPKPPSFWKLLLLTIRDDAFMFILALALVFLLAVIVCHKNDPGQSLRNPESIRNPEVK